MNYQKTLMITGAFGSLGEEICRKFYKEYKLLLIDKKAPPEFVDDLNNDGGDIKIITADLVDPNSIKSIGKYISNRDCIIQGVILAAGTICFKSFHNITVEEWKETIEVNLTSNFLICKEVVPFLTKQGFGHIVLIGSVLGKVACYDLFAYSVSKAALIHFTKNLALDLLDYNVNVNCICPGFMESEMFQNVLKSETLNRKNWFHLLGGLPKRTIQKRDISELIDYLLNQEAMTGEEIILDGGYSIR